jgi:hypothetical protein
MRVSDGTVVGTLTSNDGARVHDLVQGEVLSPADGIAVTPSWIDQPGVEIVCKVAPGVHVSVHGRRRTGMFVLGPGQAFSLKTGRTGEAAERTWTLLCADQVPVAAEASSETPNGAHLPAGRCAFCHRSIGRAGVIVDAAGLSSRWQALLDGPLCTKCASGIADGRQAANGRNTP